MLEFIREKAKGKRIIILGFGLEGLSTLKYLLSQKEKFKEIIISDFNEQVLNHSLIKEHQITCFVGDRYQKQIDKDDFIIKSPGIKLEAHLQSMERHSQTSLFLEKYQKKIIGITGTKGKSTTSTMMYQILKDQKKDAFLVGNIGQPAFDMIEKMKEDSWIVYELSAHQLQCVSHGPHYAILLNLMPEHLDFFQTTEKYYLAKCQIFNQQVQGSFRFIAKSCEAFTNKYGIRQKENFSKVENLALYHHDQAILKENDLQFLLGHHHIENIQALVELVLFLGLDLSQALNSIRQFHPLAHRQELLGEKNGIRFINDSISTIPQSAIQAVKAIGKVDVLILGGLDRGVDYSELVAFLSKERFKKVYFLGKAGERVKKELLDKQVEVQFEYSWNEKLQDIRNELLKIKNSTVLLSPAAASYDAFKNFEERGDYFREVFSEICEKK